MELRDGNLLIRPLVVEDVFQMDLWGRHETPLLGDYNFPRMTAVEKRRWYRFKTLNIFNKYYGVLLDGRLIGYMGIKNIKRLKREATLGIVFDPNYINKGYGTRTLKLFLDYYFNQMKMEIMYLEVAKFNDRAMRVYQKLGFKTTSYYYDKFYNQRLDLNNPYYLQAKDDFVIVDDKIYIYIYKMKLSKGDFKRET